MTYAELTPAGFGRYDGYMDPSAESQANPDVMPSPITSEAGRSLWRNTARGAETGDEPEAAKTDAQPEYRQKAQKEKKTGLTRDKLTEIAQAVQITGSGGEVRKYAEFVVAAANVLEAAVMKKTGQNDASQELRDKLEKAGVFERAQRILQDIDSSAIGDEDRSARSQGALRQAGQVSKLATEIAGYFEAAKLTLERDDPFKPITSFEELMGKFNKIQLDARFRPGGEFSLIDVSEYTDEFGRTLLKEKAHPENFLRWVRERAWFYHDFDPMANIDLFKGMYIVAGSRTVSMYEMVVDFDTYFAHRQETYGDLRVSTLDLSKAQANKTFVPSGKDVRDIQPGELYGNYVFRDEATGKEIKYNVVLIAKNEEGYAEFNVLDEEGSNVRALLQNKEEWNNADSQQSISKEFVEAKTEIMYEIWLLTRNHNMDVAYRQKGMPNEQPLKETLAELYADNIWTRTRSRLLKMFNMPTTTHRGDRVLKIDSEGKPVLNEFGDQVWEVDTHNETTEKMEKFGELGYQGSTGKAFQRSTALYYHMSEANAAFNGYRLEDGRNPFFELFQKGEINGAEIFYKSLIRRTLGDVKFKTDGLSYEYDKDHPEKNTVAAEFVGRLNDTGVPRSDGTRRQRKDWEKADLFDFLTLSKNEFLSSVQSKYVSQELVDEVVAEMQKKYGSDSPRMAELQRLLTQSSESKKSAFLASLRGKSNIGDSAYQAKEVDDKGNEVKKEGFIHKFQNKRDLTSLSAFAVALFVQSYPAEYAPDINPFVNIRYPLEARERMREAMRDALMHTEQIDSFEAKYAEEWAYTFAFHSGISARNDMQGIGHDAWSKILNTEFYRLRQTGGGNYPGNLDNLYGIHRLGADMWQGLKVQVDGSNKYNKSLYEILTGLDSKTLTFKINDDMPSYEFAGNAMRQYYADHVAHVIDLFIDITQKHEFNFDKIVKEDQLGRVTINHAEMQKLIDTTWKHLRYGFDNNGMLYENTMHGWWYDEKIKPDGQISRTPHFGFKKLGELMFSEEIREMGMYNRKDVSSWAPTEDNRAMKMGRNVFAYLIKAQLEEHTKRKGEAHLYTADQISLIVDAFNTYAARIMKGEHGEALVLSGFFSPEETYRILAAAGAILWMLYAKEYGKDFLGGFIAAFFQMMQMITKEIGGSITLKPS